MEDRKLTRDEIALQLLSAGLSAASGKDRYAPETYIPDPLDEMGKKTASQMVRRAFNLADLFIQERDKKG